MDVLAQMEEKVGTIQHSAVGRLFPSGRLSPYFLHFSLQMEGAAAVEAASPAPAQISHSCTQSK